MNEDDLLDCCDDVCEGCPLAWWKVVLLAWFFLS